MTMMKKKLYKMMMASKVCLVSFEHKRRLRWKTFGNAWRKNGNGTPGHMEILTLEMHGSKFLRKLAISKGFGREVLVWFGEDGWKCQKKWLSEAVALSQLVRIHWCWDSVSRMAVTCKILSVDLLEELERDENFKAVQNLHVNFLTCLYYLLWPLIFYTYEPGG